MHSKSLLFSMAILLAVSGCKKDKIGPTEILVGGKGGRVSLVVFTHRGIYAQTSRVFLKHAANKRPSDTSQYNEVQNTMVEPGYGPHVHFNSLIEGTYFVHAEAMYNNVLIQKDSVLQITTGTPDMFDVHLRLE